MNMPFTDFGTTTSHNPATGETLATIPNTNMNEFPQLVEKARIAQKAWGEKSFKQRRVHIEKMRRYIVENGDRIARIVSDENGKTPQDALLAEVIPSALACGWYGSNAAKVLKPKGRTMGSILFMQKRSKIMHLPLGVVGIISPWNYPLSIPFGEIVMGLMAGNAIILKVAAATPLVGKAIEDIIAAGDLPDGLFTHVVGSGGAVSTAMFDNRLNKVFFTGSVPTGKQLMAQAAPTLTPLSLELGGKDAMVVLAGANLERAANGAAWAGYQNAGQSCGAVERIYVHESVYDEFLSLLKTKTAALRHGKSAAAGDADLGCMTTEKQLQTVQHQLEDALNKGAVIEAQSTAGDITGGTFHAATLITNVNNDMEVMREETFGPILPVEKFGSVEDGIARANDCSMALTASVWGKTAEAKKVAEKLEGGVVTVNDHLMTHGMSEMPWGGPKESGIGRTHGPEGLLEMTRPQAISWDMMPGYRNLWWYPQNADSYANLLAALKMGNTKNPISFMAAALKVFPALIKGSINKWQP